MARTVLVTGANRGIGFYIVQALASGKPDDQLILAARSLEKATGAIDELRKLGVRSDHVDSLALDITDDASIKAAEKTVRERYGKLDVLINNAAIALYPSPDEIDALRSIYNAIYDTNVSAVALVMSIFLPLLVLSPDPRVINVSSVAGSLGIVSKLADPITPSIPYTVSKAALNMLTIEYRKLHPNVLFHARICLHAVNPGYCRTGLNDFQGERDPLGGASVVVDLTNAERDKYKSGFWEKLEGAKECSTLAW
ncbi:hypothetical protein BKA93DRAFT_725229 [Sparassis latifolia]